MSSKSYLKLDGNLGLRELQAGSRECRILCFPFVGGQSLSFRALSRSLPAGYTVLGIDPPGHGWAEGTPLTSFTTMVDLYHRELSFLTERPLVLFGHSLGGIVAYRLTQLLEEKGFYPEAVFLSAAPLPHRICEYEYLRAKSNRELLEIMAGHDAATGAFLDNDLMMNFYAGTIRADLTAFLSCNVSRRPNVRTPLYVLYSRQDTFMAFDLSYEWEIYGSDVSFREVPGDHLFVQSHPGETAARIKEVLMYEA